MSRVYASTKLSSNFPRKEKPDWKTVRTTLPGPFLLKTERIDSSEHRDDDEDEDHPDREVQSERSSGLPASGRSATATTRLR
jgi:hypothetical protein